MGQVVPNGLDVVSAVLTVIQMVGWGALVEELDNIVVGVVFSVVIVEEVTVDVVLGEMVFSGVDDVIGELILVWVPELVLAPTLDIFLVYFAKIFCVTFLIVRWINTSLIVVYSFKAFFLFSLVAMVHCPNITLKSGKCTPHLPQKEMTCDL